MEGVLLAHDAYSPNERKVRVLLEELTSFCREKKIELFLVSGFHESVALHKFSAAGFGEFFDKEHFVCVDEVYIGNKSEADMRLHRSNLEKDKDFADNYFKQVFISDKLKEKRIAHKDALLLGDDLWVDGYYTTRFSKIDFAIFEEHIVDRGRNAERISGLAYFNINFSSVKQLLEGFPATDNSALDRHIFEEMKKVLVGDTFADAVKKGMIKKTVKKQGLRGFENN